MCQPTALHALVFKDEDEDEDEDDEEDEKTKRAWWRVSLFYFTRHILYDVIDMGNRSKDFQACE